MKQNKNSRKIARIQINDIFDDINQENNRLKNELLFANKCINILYKFKYYLNRICDNFGNNLDQKLAQELNKLEEDYKELIEEKQNENNLKPKVISSKSYVKKPVVKLENDFSVIDNQVNSDFEANNESLVQSIDSHLGLNQINESLIDFDDQNEAKFKTDVKSKIVKKYKNMNFTNKNNKYIFRYDI